MTTRPALAAHARAATRKLAPDYVFRLRKIIARVGSLHRAARDELGTSPGVLEDALSEGTFRAATVERLELAIDTYLRSPKGAGLVPARVA